MGLKLEEDGDSIVVRGPEGLARFRKDVFKVIEDEKEYKIIEGPFEEEIWLQEEAQHLKIEYHGKKSLYIVQMVNKFASGFAPDLKAQFLACYHRKQVPFTEICGSGAEGLLYGNGAEVQDDLLVPDHAFFAALDAQHAKILTQSGFHKIGGQIVQEVESANDTRKPGTNRWSTDEKCVRYLESGQVELVIAWYPRTKEVQLHWLDAQGNLDRSEVFFNPEWVPLDHWPGGHFLGLRLYLSYLRARPALWGDFVANERYNPDGSQPRWQGRDQDPVDPPQVARRQALYEARLQPLPSGKRIDVVVETVRDGDLEDVRSSVAHCDTLRMRSTDGRLALVEAIACNDLEKVQELILQGADVVQQDEYGRSALSMASLLGPARAAISNHLSTLGAALPPVTLEDAARWLQKIVTKDAPPPGLLDETACLLESARPGAVALALEELIVSTDPRKPAQIRALLETVEGTRYIGMVGAETEESLFAAIVAGAIRGAEDGLKVLGEYGVLDARGEDGITALMSLAQSTHVKGVRALCKAGADLEAEDERGFTALGFALETRKKKMARELIKLGAETKDEYKEFEIEP